MNTAAGNGLGDHEDNRSIAQKLLSTTKGKEWLASLPEDELARIRYLWEFWARKNQLPPPEPWNRWLIMTGRGWGKNRTAAEYINAAVRYGEYKYIGLIARFVRDVRDTMIEGESGIKTVATPDFKPLWEPAKRKLTWPNGVTATTFTAEEPDALRGPSHDFVWADEIAAWQDESTWDMAMFGLRLGKARWLATTTPKPVPLIKRLLKQSITAGPEFIVTTGTTYDNLLNLSETFKREVVEYYQGTTLGLQELEAKLLLDIPDALWKRAELDTDRVTKEQVPQLTKIAVAVDPSVTHNKGSNECGIVIGGVGEDGHGYVFGDNSKKDTPLGWARTVLETWKMGQANAIIVETNNGGLMVETTIRTVAKDEGFDQPRIISVVASKGKYTRAEPVASRYEQHVIHHVGTLGALEDELCTWCIGDPSPNRLDALVWLMTWLDVQGRRGIGYGLPGGPNIL